MEQTQARDSISLSDCSCTTPELQFSTHSQRDDEGVSTADTTPRLLVGDNGPDPQFVEAPMSDDNHHWQLLVPDIAMLFGESSDCASFDHDTNVVPSSIETPPWPNQDLVLPGAQGMRSCVIPGSKRVSEVVNLENKRKPGHERRTDPSLPNYRPIPLLSMDPRQLTYTTQFKQEALRTWLLERRALLQKLREDVTRDRLRLQHETACLDEIPARVAQRIDTLSRLSSTFSDVPPLWDVATLLEQDILCL